MRLRRSRYRQALTKKIVNYYRENFEIVYLIIPQNAQVHALARAMAIDCFVKCLAFMDFRSVGAQDQITLAQSGFLARTPRHHSGDHDMLAQRVGNHSEL